MPKLLSGSSVLQDTSGTSAVFISLPTAQPYLGLPETTTTGYTLVLGPKGKLIFTSTLGSISFKDGIISSDVRNGNLLIVPNGTGTVTLFGNVSGSQVISTFGAFNQLAATTSTFKDVTVTGTISFTSVTTTTTFYGGVSIEKNLKVVGQFDSFGPVNLSPIVGDVTIETTGSNVISVISSSTGSIDNIAIGQKVAANGQFVDLTATNLFVETFFINTGTFNKVRVLSTESDAVTVAGGVEIATSVFAGSVFDSGTRVISRIDVGPGLSINTSTGPSVIITNTGVLSLTAGTDTSVNTSTGDVTVWNISTFQTVTDRGNSSTNQILILNTSSSTSTTTGALLVSGGVGISENLYAFRSYEDTKRVLTEIEIVTNDGLSGGQKISYENTLTVFLTNTGVLENIAGDGISVSSPTGHVIITNTGVLSLIAGTGTSVSSPTGNVTVWNTSTLQSVTDNGSETTNSITITNDTNSTSTFGTGALIVSGGISVGKDIKVIGDVYSNSGSPEYNNLLYTPQVYFGFLPNDPKIGDFWIDPDTGVEYQFVPNGTQPVWVQFIGF